jgi:hypothetical protein
LTPRARSLQPGAADDSASHIAASHGEGADHPATDADVDDEPGFRRRKLSRAALRKLRARESERVKVAKPPLAGPPASPAARALRLSDADASSGCGDDSGGDDSDALSLAAPAALPATRKRRRGQHAENAPSLNPAAVVRVGLEQAALMTASFMSGPPTRATVRHSATHLLCPRSASSLCSHAQRVRSAVPTSHPRFPPLRRIHPGRALEADAHRVPFNLPPAPATATAPQLPRAAPIPPALFRKESHTKLLSDSAQPTLLQRLFATPTGRHSALQGSSRAPIRTPSTTRR